MIKTPEQVYNETRIRNIKRAKLKQKEAELKLAIKHDKPKLIDEITYEINKLKSEI